MDRKQIHMDETPGLRIDGVLAQEDYSILILLSSPSGRKYYVYETYEGKSMDVSKDILYDEEMQEFLKDEERFW